MFSIQYVANEWRKVCTVCPWVRIRVFHSFSKYSSYARSTVFASHLSSKFKQKFLIELVDLYKIRNVLNAPQALEKVKLSSREIILKAKGHDPYRCPKCKVGFMVVVTITSGIQGFPLRFFAKDKPIKLEKA